MDQTALYGNTQTNNDMVGMTPISRLIPKDSSGSGNGNNYSESAPRMMTTQGAGNVPPMAPPAQTRDSSFQPQQSESEDVVSDILRDVERGNSTYDTEQYGHPQQSNQPQPSHTVPQYSHPEPSTVRFQEQPTHAYNQHHEEPPEMMRQTTAINEIPNHTPNTEVYDDDSGLLGDDFIDTILKEARLPLIVAGIILLAGLSNADDILAKIIPALVTDGGVGYAGLVAKSIIGGLLFYAVLKIFL